MPPNGLRVTFLGTGTSVGIPVITCSCDVCTSADPRNSRLRASILIEWPEASRPDGVARLLVDTATDLRQQALRAGLNRLDAVFYTHAHADHVLGLDELRIYNFVHRRSIPLYGSAETLATLERMFAYAFDPNAIAVPRLDPMPVDRSTEILGQRVEAIPVQHGPIQTLALRIGDFAYATDCNGIDDEAAGRLRDLDVLVIDALRRKPHRSHFSLDQALAQIERLRPKRAYLTHLSHELEHAVTEARLPEDVLVAYDGLELTLPLPVPTS